MSNAGITITKVETRRQLKQFVELPYRIYSDDPHWVPPLRSEVYALLSPKKNPLFKHCDIMLFIAERDGRTVGRISAQIDHMATAQPAAQGIGPGTGHWGLMEAEDKAVMLRLIDTAEDWLRDNGMSRVLAPVSMSMWEEPGLLTQGHDHSPTVMMGHHKAEYQQWIESHGYGLCKELFTYALRIYEGFPKLVNRIVASGERNDRIKIRTLDKKNFAAEARIVLDLLNDAWSDNWGFVPWTDHEIAHASKALKPIIFSKINLIAEVEGEPVAFMMTLPNMNQITKAMGGSLWPFNWAKILWWLRAPKSELMRVPLMGVKKELQNSRLASQLAFMMIEYIRRNAVENFGSKYAEIGWVLDDNQGMKAIAGAIESEINRVYSLYEKPLR